MQNKYCKKHSNLCVMNFKKIIIGYISKISKRDITRIHFAETSAPA